MEIKNAVGDVVYADPKADTEERTQVQRASARLEATVDTLSDLTDGLMKRMEPVLRPEDFISELGETVAGLPTCPLAAHLDGQSTRLDNIAELIRHTLGRLEL